MKQQPSEDLIHSVDLTKVNEAQFKKQFVSCLILTKDEHIILQKRDEESVTYPGYIATFGGRIEENETPLQALQREIREELGGEILAKDVISIGTYTEAITHHTELIYAYFWHDKNGTITGCYEGEIKYFVGYADTLRELTKHPKVMDDVYWLLNQCHARQLIK